jgi:hypothetical protein
METKLGAYITLVYVEITGLQKMMKLVCLRLGTQADAVVSGAYKGWVLPRYCVRTSDVAERGLGRRQSVKAHGKASSKMCICRFIELKQITQVISWLCSPDQSAVKIV